MTTPDPEPPVGDPPAAGSASIGRPPAEASGSVAEDPLAERIVRSRVVHSGRFIDLQLQELERADGSRSVREVVGHPGAVAVVAHDADGQVVLVRQWRAPAGRALLEIPAGTLDRDPTTGALEDPALAAARELAEETGLSAARWRRLGTFWTAPGFATEQMHLYLATDLGPAEGGHAPDEDERLEIVRLPVGEALAAIERGDIADAKSLVGLFWLERLGGAAPPGSAAAARLHPGPGDGAIVDVSFPIRMGDQMRASAILAGRSRLLQVVGLVNAVLGVGLSLIVGDPQWLILTLLGVAIGSGLAVVPLVGFQLRGRRDLFGTDAHLTADELGLRYKGGTSVGAFEWRTFRRIREIGGFLFLEVGVGPTLFVPLRAFERADLARLRALAEAAGVTIVGRSSAKAA